MKGLLLIGIFMFCPVSILWGQDRIQQYAGTAMPYPIVKDSFVFFQDSMVPIPQRDVIAGGISQNTGY